MKSIWLSMQVIRQPFLRLLFLTFRVWDFFFFLYLALGKVSVLSYLMSQNFLNGTVQYQITEKYFIKQN